jgi:acyl dehydratase
VARLKNKEPSLRTFRYDEITVGMREAHDYVISQEVYQGFLDTFHDHSPVHVDDSFAKARGFFEGRVMHGTILNGFISHFIGMHFPGRFSLLLSVDLRFSNPSFLGDAIRLESVVSQKLDARSIVVLDATLSNTTRNWLAARGRIQVMIKEQA